MENKMNITRLWCKSRNNVLNGEGFLRDISISVQPFFHDEKNLFTWEEINGYKSLVLLGEAGSGKSVTILNELDRKDNTIYHNLAEYSDESRLICDVFMSNRFTQWKSSGEPLALYLDDFDVAFRNIKTLPLILKRQLNTIKDLSSLLSLRLICRSGYWTNDLDEFLKMYFGEDNHEIFQIAPLSKNDILCLVDDEKINTSFIDDVISHEVQPFAVNPVSLKLLITDYKQNKHLSITRSQLYENGCKALCSEPKEYRQFQNPSSLSVDKSLAIASRIAALMVFCNKSHIDIRQNPPYDERRLTLIDIQEGLENTDKYSFLFTQPDIIEVVTNTSLFSYLNKYSYSFYHWSYAEYLAARFILNHEFSIEQILSLITVSSDNDGMVVEQVKGTASWLGTLSQSLLEINIKQDPLSILAGDLLNESEKYKCQLIESLFEKLATVTITDGNWNLRYQYYKLNYSGLSDQIRPYLMNKENNFLTKRVAVDIIESCELRELSSDLLTIAMDKSADQYLRGRVIHTLAELGNEEERRSLKPYAIEPQDDDGDDEIKGAALKATWPDITSTAEVFDALTPFKKDSLIGSYKMFINYILAEKIENNYLSDALKWCQRYPQFIARRYNNDLKRLSDIITYQCWKNYSLLNNIQLFAEVILLRIQNHVSIFPIPENFQKKWEPLNVSREIKHNMLICLINFDSVREDNIYYLWSVSLIDNEDFDFVLSHFTAKENVDNRMKWACLLSYFEYSDANRIDSILKLIENYNELKTVFSEWLKTVELNSDEARELKAQWVKQQWLNEREISPTLKIDVQKKLFQKISSLELTNNWIYFIEFFRDLTLTSTSRIYGDILNPDVTGFEAWKGLSVSLKSRVEAFAKKFLEENDDCYREWFGKNIFHGTASTGYKCLVLFNKYDSDTLESLSTTVWEKWAHIILAYPQASGISGTDQSYKLIIQYAYSKKPNILINIIKELIKSDNKEDDSTLFILYRIEHIIDDQIINVFIELINEGALYARPSADLIRYVFKFCYPTASQIAKQLLKQNDLKSILVGVEFAKYCNETDWIYLMNYFKDNDEFAEKLFLKYASDYYIDKNPLWSRLKENQIASLYLFLYSLFPPETDPQFEGAHFVGPREGVTSFRESLLQNLINKGTLEAISAMESINEKIPSDSIKFQLVAAKDIYRKLNWHPFAPSDFLKLSENGNMRIISNNADLLNLIIESLYRLEERLQKENSLSFALWDFVKRNETTKKALYKPKKEELLSDFIKDHLTNDIQKYGVLSFREVQIKRANCVHMGAAGEKIDILVSYSNKRYSTVNKVIIEVKGSWNPGVKESLQAQLVDRYIKTDENAYGLYLIGWFDCEAYDDCKNYTGNKLIDDAKRSYDENAKKVSSDNVIVKSFILDCRMKN